MLFDGTHPALVTQQMRAIIQRVRQNKRRSIRMKEQDKYPEPVVCADCGATMVLHRAHTMKPTWNNFACYTYKKKGKEVCNAHYIRECVLDEVILEDLRRIEKIIFPARLHRKEGPLFLCGPAVRRRLSESAAPECAGLSRPAGLDYSLVKMTPDEASPSVPVAVAAIPAVFTIPTHEQHLPFLYVFS